MKEPEPELLQLSNLLTQDIINNTSIFYHQDIVNQKPAATFADYMQQVLYHPEHGYYCNYLPKFGAGGDFITAPELGDIFAKAIVNKINLLAKNIINAQSSCNYIHADNEGIDILEIGAGTGKLAYDLITILGSKINNYYIFEVSPNLRQRQQERLSIFNNNNINNNGNNINNNGNNSDKIDSNKIIWLDKLPNKKIISGIIIANEVLDAIPVERFILADNKLYQQGVSYNNASQKFQYCNLIPSDELLTFFNNYLSKLNLSSPYCSEINLNTLSWLQSIKNCLQSGYILLFDYGFPKTEFYHPDRNMGTLMCHYQHYCHPCPFWYPGLQDITSHVDFSLVANNAQAINLSIDEYTPLSKFIIDSYLQYQINLNSDEIKQVNTLTSPAEMGELFKFMNLSI